MPFIALDRTAAQAAPASGSIGAPRTSYGYTFLAMQEELRQRLGGRQDVSLPRLKQWINDAYIDLVTSVDQLRSDSSIVITTVDDQPLYLLPEVVFAIKTASLVNEDLVYGGLPLDRSDITGYRAASEQDGWPTIYFTEEDMLIVWPTPDAAYSIVIDFMVRPAELVDDTDSPYIAREWHEGILLKARANAYSNLQEFEKAAIADNDYIRFIERRMSDLEVEDQYRVVKSAVPKSRRDMRRGRYFPTGEPGF